MKTRRTVTLGTIAAFGSTSTISAIHSLAQQKESFLFNENCQQEFAD